MEVNKGSKISRSKKKLPGWLSSSLGKALKRATELFYLIFSHWEIAYYSNSVIPSHQSLIMPLVSLVRLYSTLLASYSIIASKTIYRI